MKSNLNAMLSNKNDNLIELHFLTFLILQKPCHIINYLIFSTSNTKDQTSRLLKYYYFFVIQIFAKKVIYSI